MLFAAILFCGITGHSHAQKWALKTNTLSWAVLAPNIGAELGLSGKVSMELSGSYKPWTVLDKSNIRLWLVQPEVRYWLCETFEGHFFGIHMHGAQYYARTGGQVITSGNAISLSKSAQPYWTSDYRISINVLPTEDITGKGQLTLTYYNGRSAVYSLKSTSGRIPISPNQITWLVMGRDCHYGGNDNDSEAESRIIFGDMQKSDMNTSIGHDEDSCIEF